MQKLYTRKQIAELINVHPDTVKNWERKGIITPAARINDRPRYSKEGIEKLIKQPTAQQ